MMFGWYEMDLALGRVRDIPPLQGVGFYVAVFPGRCPELSHCAPLGRKTGALLGPKTGASLGACEGHSAPLGRGVLCGRFPRALPWAITLCPVGAEDRCPFGAEDRCTVGAEDRCPFWGRLMLSVRRTIILRGCAARLICVCFIAGIPFGVLRFAVSRRYRRSESFFDVFWSFGVDRKRISSDRIGFNNPR